MSCPGDTHRHGHLYEVPYRTRRFHRLRAVPSTEPLDSAVPTGNPGFRSGIAWAILVFKIVNRKTGGATYMFRITLCTITLLCAASAPAQQASQEQDSPTGEVELRERFHWGPAVAQSFLFVSIEHSLRLTQAKTRREFQGKFMKDYWTCIKNIQGWGDGDGVFTNYVAHPMQGGVAGFLQIQNDPAGRRQELSLDGAYWRSRLKGMAWAAAYSTQFEIGPISEATIGHVGKRDGTAGYTDLVVTPLGGLGMTVLEDAARPLRHQEVRIEGLATRLAMYIASGPEPTTQPGERVAVQVAVAPRHPRPHGARCRGRQS